MASPLDGLDLLLFLPADRPDRLARALAAGADAVILDLEDAVAPNAKSAARDHLLRVRNVLAESSCPVLLRVNGADTPFQHEDLTAAARLPLAGVVLPKADSVQAVHSATEASGHPVIALIESAQGLAQARAIAERAARLAFGSIDFAADLGCAHTREALLAARSELVLASRMAGCAGPIDGVTTDFRDPVRVEEDARYAAELGFTGKLLIHPMQIGPARTGLTPREDEVAWARQVLATTAESGATAVDGAMVDAPVRLRAERIRRRAAALRRMPS